MSYSFSSLDELGEGYGFRKVRKALGVDGLRRQRDRLPAGLRGLPPLPRRAGRALLRPLRARPASRSTARSALLGPGGLCHVASTTPRKVSNVGEDDLVLLVIGGKGGYVERDGHLVDPEDAARRASFGQGLACDATDARLLERLAGGLAGAARV